MNVTFDTNCIIALEKGEATAPDLRRIVQSAAERKLTLRVVAISASEKSATLDDFKRKLTDAGLAVDFVQILPAPGIWDEVYWDQASWMSDETDEELKRIHKILFPDHSFTTSAVDGDPRERWRSRMVDTCALWTHLHHGGGVFVTSDNNFHNKQAKLRTSILTPQEASVGWGRDDVTLGDSTQE